MRWFTGRREPGLLRTREKWVNIRFWFIFITMKYFSEKQRREDASVERTERYWTEDLLLTSTYRWCRCFIFWQKLWWFVMLKLLKNVPILSLFLHLYLSDFTRLKIDKVLVLIWWLSLIILLLLIFQRLFLIIILIILNNAFFYSLTITMSMTSILIVWRWSINDLLG